MRNSLPVRQQERSSKKSQFIPTSFFHKNLRQFFKYIPIFILFPYTDIPKLKRIIDQQKENQIQQAKETFLCGKTNCPFFVKRKQKNIIAHAQSAKNDGQLTRPFSLDDKAVWKLERKRQ